jgi:hypothetical protein
MMTFTLSHEAARKWKMEEPRNEREVEMEMRSKEHQLE